MENKTNLVRLAESGNVPVREITQEERYQRTRKLEGLMQESKYKQAMSKRSLNEKIVRNIIYQSDRIFKKISSNNEKSNYLNL